MTECAWCGATDGPLFSRGDWHMCKACCAVCSAGPAAATVPVAEIERMFARYATQSERNEARRPAHLPPLPPEAAALLAAIAAATTSEARLAAKQQLAVHRDVLRARSVCYFCSAAIGSHNHGAGGPNVHICATCLAEARDQLGL